MPAAMKDDQLAHRPVDAPLLQNKAPLLGPAGLQAITVVSMIVLLGGFGYTERTGAAITSAVACLAALLLLRFTSIGKLEALGLKVENATREAHDATEEAKATVSQVRALAAEVGKISLDQLALRNRLGVIGPKALIALRDRVSTTLKVAGCSDAEIRRATKLLNTSIAVDRSYRVAEAVHRAAPHEKDVSDRIYALRPDKFEAIPLKPMREAIPAAIRENEQVARALAAYERYERTGEVDDAEESEDFFDESILG